MAANRLSIVEAFGDSINYTGTATQQYFGLTRGTNSIFNKFSLFRYHKYGPSFTSYNSDMHYDGKDASNEPSPDQQAQDARTREFYSAQANGPTAIGNYNDKQKALEAQQFKASGTTNTAPVVAQAVKTDDIRAIQNPTARAIIQWSRNDNKIWGPTPYSWTDFIYCKNNGKIPNNRLVTLRRFPFPVRDNLKTDGGENVIPISQAVTWFGEATQNPLGEIIPGLQWALPFKMLDAQDANLVVQGNNLTISEIIDALGKLPMGVGQGVQNLSTTLKAFIGAAANVNGNTAQLDDLSGRYEKMQDFLQNKLYSSTGPYWNQILGGVNYITQTMIRDRLGASQEWLKPITLNFHYSLRSFNNFKPKIAMLDLISNFLSLTFMNADFKGNFTRFFRNSGISSDTTIDDKIAELAQKNDWLGALKLSAASVGVDILAAIGNTTDLRSLNLSGAGTATQNQQGKGLLSTNMEKAINGALTALMARNLAKGPVTMRSTLSARETGEWHLVIGNPMDPIATIGNLNCTSCKMKFGEELGPDDFPTEVTFTVTLQMAKPRDKYQIDSMFNLGNGFLTENPIQPPAGDSNTFDNNSTQQMAAVQSTQGKNDYLTNQTQNSQNNSPLTVANRLNIAYGPIYANSGVLPLYFMDSTAKGNVSDTPVKKTS